MYARLLDCLEPQIRPGVQALYLSDDGELSIGAKRQALLCAASAEFVSFIDDDDLVSPDYVPRIWAALSATHPPDVVGFRLRYFEGDTLAGVAVHSYRAAEIPAFAKPGVHRQDRQPNHLNPVRRALALKAGGYKPLNFGEDADYAARLAALKPQPREVFIDGYLYDYLYRHPDKRRGERTNERLTGRR